MRTPHCHQHHPGRACAGALLTFLALLNALAALPASAEIAALPSWQPVGPPGGTISLVVFAPSDPRFVYTATPNSAVFCSRNGGATWTFCGRGLPAGPVLALAVDPRNPSASSWRSANTGLFATDVSALAIDPERPATVYAATRSSGLLRSRDAGQRWQSVPVVIDDFPVTGMEALAINPGNPLDLYAAAGSGVAHSSDGGRTWSFGDAEDCDFVNSVTVDPSSPSRYAGGTQFMLHGCSSLGCDAFVSRDGGRNWGCLPLPAIATEALDPVNSSTLYAGGAHLWKSIDGGRSFVSPASAPGSVVSLAVSPVAHRIVYAGTCQSGVFRSADAGRHWSPASGGLPPGVVGGLVADPLEAGTVYAGIRQKGVFRSRDGGATWQPLGEGLPVQLFWGALSLAPGDHRTLYAGTAGAGVYALGEL